MEVSKAPPPLLGFNNNVRHRGRIFHIQTEDSGVKFPRIVTHLFADGGRIVKTTRTDYSEHLAKSDMAAVVRAMMKDQHKAMFAALRAGDLDALLENVCGPLDPAKPPVPESDVDPTLTKDMATARVVVSHSAPVPSSQPSSLPVPGASSEPLPPPAPVADAQAVIEGMKSLRDSDESPRSKRPLSNPNLRRPTPSVGPPAPEAFDLDVASLDQHPPKGTASPAPPSARPPRKLKSRPPIPARPAAALAAGADAGSPPRPPPRLATPPQSTPRSIFGDGAISEQSLDEVILSYLAEDLEETK